MRTLLTMTAACALLLAACGPSRPAVYRAPDGRKLKGHERPYTVAGKRYVPILDASGFSQTGLASWYGPDFHGKRTSNGEVYDMHAMTAAHKTLPMGVFVKVQNRDNGTEAIVRVNDRGPFVRGRIIDLSYAAAKDLGVVQNGTVPVRITALGFRSTDRDGRDTYTPADYDSGTYTVQTGSFTRSANADRQAAQMRRLHGFSEIRQAEVNGETFYRVYAGKYGSLRLAEKARERFERDGYPGSFVVALD